MDEQMKLGFTYLLYDGVNYKIGMSTRSVETRLAELNSASGLYNKIEIIAYCGNSDCEVLERSLHAKYANERINPKREWFNLSDEQVQDIILKYTEVSIGVDNILPDVSVEYKLYKKYIVDVNLNLMWTRQKHMITLEDFKEYMANSEYSTYEEAEALAVEVVTEAMRRQNSRDLELEEQTRLADAEYAARLEEETKERDRVANEEASSALTGFIVLFIIIGSVIIASLYNKFSEEHNYKSVSTLIKSNHIVKGRYHLYHADGTKALLPADNSWAGFILYSDRLKTGRFVYNKMGEGTYTHGKDTIILDIEFGFLYIYVDGKKANRFTIVKDIS